MFNSVVLDLFTNADFWSIHADLKHKMLLYFFVCSTFFVSFFRKTGFPGEGSRSPSEPAWSGEHNTEYSWSWNSCHFSLWHKSWFQVACTCRIYIFLLITYDLYAIYGETESTFYFHILLSMGANALNHLQLWWLFLSWNKLWHMNENIIYYANVRFQGFFSCFNFRPVAFFSTDIASTLSVKEVNETCRKHLPTYMLPVVMKLDSIPLQRHTGKVR